ncbi:MAG TPA: prolyl oligopeptidase family serine peptidase [Caulobacteraceae bacterium]
MVRFLLAALAVFSVAWASPSLAADVSAYGRLPAIDQVTLSPSGARLAYITTTGEQRRLVVMELPEKVLVNVPVGQTKVRDTYWAGEDHLLVKISNTQSEDYFFAQQELDQYVSVNVNTQKAVAIFSHDPTIFHAVLGFAGSGLVGGKYYGFFSGITLEKASGFDGADRELGHTYPDLYRVDLDTGVNFLVTHGSLVDHRWLVDAKGVLAAHTNYDQATTSWELYADGPGYHLVSKVTGGGDLLGFGRTAGTVVIKTDKLEEWTLADQSHVSLPLVDGREVDGMLSNPNTGLAMGVWLQGPDEVRLFDPAFDARFKSIQRALNRPTHLESWSADFKRLIVETDGKGDSGTYWLIDGGEAKIIDNPYPDVVTATVGDSQEITYKAGDGLEIHGILTLPEGRAAKNLPIVVMPHGGPEGHDSIGFDWIAQAFVAQGYAVFQPNFRGSDGYTDAFRDAGFGEWGRKMQTDISDGLAELARRHVVDPKRACAVGLSYGGYAALASVTIQHDIYRCAVSVAGVSDLNEMLAWEHKMHNGNLTDEVRYWRKFMGATSDGDTSLHNLSPARLASTADAPILLIHGDDDTTVPIEQSRLMESALRSAGKPVEFLTLKGEEHQLLRETGRKAMLAAAVDFVLKYNPPDPAATAAAVPATPPGSSR